MPAQPPIVIHHITDLHVGPLHEAASKKLQYVKDSGRPRNLQHYSDFLRATPPANRPDLVVVSGDLTSYATEDEMNCASDELRAIRDLLCVKPWREGTTNPPDMALSSTSPHQPLGDSLALRPRMLVVPGNHDLDWTKASRDEKIDRFSRLAALLRGPGTVLFSRSASAPNALSEPPPYFDFGDDWNLFVFLFDSTTYGGSANPILKGVHQRFSDVYRSVVKARAGRDLEDALDQLKKEMVEDPGYVGQEQIAEMQSALTAIPKRRFKIAVMHHNPSAVPADDVEAFDALVNAGLVKQALADNGFDLILHGHRHLAHCSVERTVINQRVSPAVPSHGHEKHSRSPSHDVMILGGDSLGCRPTAPFFQICLFNTENVDELQMPTTSVRVQVGELQAGRYIFRSEPFVEQPVARRMHGLLNQLLLTMGRTERVRETQQRSIRILDALLPALQDERSRLGDWGAESENWIQQFHYQLRQYRRIYATDIAVRSSAQSPRYAQYLQRQYRERLVRIRQSDLRKLHFSPRVYDTIMRTGWLPDLDMWDEYTIERSASIDQLEIVRILVRGDATPNERRLLENLDFEHRLFAIPLFVLKAASEEDSNSSDFALGLSATGSVLNSFEFDRQQGRVVQRNPHAGRLLAHSFDSLLSNERLVTVDRFLGVGVMARDPDESRTLAQSYDRTRHASPRIVSFIRSAMQPSRTKRGLEIGCGTGNYTLPFVDQFGELTGLDVDSEMLRVAKQKPGADRINWIEGDAVQSGLSTDTFDCVWAISTFHYFRDVRQKLLLQEIFRMLKAGGMMVIDNELAEQIASLWLAEFFPSLKKRYRDVCLPKRRYEEWLRDIGFADVRLVSMDIVAGYPDAALRVGQRDPTKYLDPAIRENIPAFRAMSDAEEQDGVERLRQSIESEAIADLIRGYDNLASIKGDVTFLVARKPRRQPRSGKT